MMARPRPRLGNGDGEDAREAAGVEAAQRREEIGGDGGQLAVVRQAPRRGRSRRRPRRAAAAAARRGRAAPAARRARRRRWRSACAARSGAGAGPGRAAAVGRSRSRSGADHALDVLERDAAGTEQGGLGVDEGDDRRLHADPARAAVENERDLRAELCLDVRGGGRADVAERVGARRRDRAAGARR